MRLLLATLIFSFQILASESEISNLNLEHQIRICESKDQIISKLKLNPDDFKSKDVLYVETIDQKFKASGWSIRIRKSEKKIELDLKKKISISNSLEEVTQFDCEFDLHGTTLEKTCKLNNVIDSKLFEEVLKGEKNWLHLLNNDQEKWLKNENMLLTDALILGNLLHLRSSLSIKSLGDMTIDLVNLNARQKAKDISFNEVSIRYPKDKISVYAHKFEKIVDDLGLNKCSNQIDWDINKFEVLKPIN